MARYAVTGPDGKTYEVNAPKGASQDDAIAYVAQTYYRSPAPPEEEPGVFDVLQSYTTDIPVRAVKGALGGVEAATNIFGADNVASQFLRGAQENIDEYLVSDTAKRRAAERGETLQGKGFVDTLKEIPGILARDPVLLAEALGTAAPTLGAAALTGGSSLPVQAAAMAGTGIAMGAGVVKGSIYDATKTELTRRGVPEEVADQAAEEAQAYTGENVDMIALGGVLGGIAARTGLEPAAARMVAGRILGRSVAQSAGREGLRRAAEEGVKRGALRSAVGETATEAAQGAQEQLAANLALQRQGMDIDLMEGVGGAAALEGTLGGILGGGFGIAAQRQARRQLQALEDAEAAESRAGALRPPEGYDEDTLAARFAQATGSEDFRATAQARAAARRVANDIARGAPENLAESDAYLQTLEDRIASGELEAKDIGPLTGVVAEARSTLDRFRQETADAGTPLPDGGVRGPDGGVGALGGQPSLPLDGGPAVQPPGVVEAGEPVAAPMARPEAGVAGAPVGEVGQLDTLTPPAVAPAPEVAPSEPVAAPAVAPTPAVTAPVALPPVVAPQIDLTPITSVTTMAERKKAARPIVDIIADMFAGDTVVPAKVLNQAAQRMAQAVARGEEFDPQELVRTTFVDNNIVAPEPAPAPEIDAIEEPAPVSPLADFTFDDDGELDYDAHPLMTSFNQRFDSLIEELDEVDKVASVRSRANKFIKAGVLDAGIIDDINEIMADEEPGFRGEAGRDALIEALEEARDEGRYDIEEEINQLLEAARESMVATAPEAAPAPAPAPAAEAAPEAEVAPTTAPATIEEYVDRYIAGEGRDNLEMQQFGANNAAEIEAEFQRRAQASSAEPTPAPAPTTPPAAPVAGPAVAPTPPAPPTPPTPPTPPATPPGAAPLAGMSVPQFKEANKLIRLFNDRFADAGSIQDFFNGLLGIDVLPERLNLKRKFELYVTRKSAAQRELERKFFEPMLDLMKTLNVSLEDVGLYLLARAAPDRNRKVAKVNAAFPQGGSGVPDAEAIAILAELDSRGLTAKMERVAKLHDALVNHMGMMRVRAGLMSLEQWQELRAEEPFYTPFKGFAKDGDMLVSDLEKDPLEEARMQKLLTEKRGLGMREFFKAQGRASLPFHPLYNLFNDAEALARRAETNKVYRTFYRMTEAVPGGFSNMVKNIYNESQSKTITLVSPTDPAGKRIRTDMTREVLSNRDRYHIFKDGGDTKYIEFDLSTEAGRAADRLFKNLQPAQMSEALRVATDINNVLKSLLTYRNPIYLSLVAPLRDSLDAVATAILNRNVKGSPAYKKAIAGNVALYAMQPDMWRTVARYATGREAVPGRQDLMDLLQQMVSAGGAPMSVAFRTVQERATQAKNELDWFRQQQEGDPVALGRAQAKRLGRFFDHWAEINDLVPRLATFRAATEAGISGPDAASLALDSSLNLVRRGEMSNLMDNLVPFFSAGVEGSRKVARIAKNPKTLAEVVGGLMLIGIAESLSNAAFGGDEDEDDVPDYLDLNAGKRATHLMLYYGQGGDDYVSIPLGQMLGYFKYLGNKMADTWLGVSSGEEAGMAIQGASLDALEGMFGLLSPARIPGGDIERAATAFIPLMGKPIVDLAINKNFFGSAIYERERPDSAPAAELGRATTAEMWKSLAKGINEATGGSPVEGGFVNFQPEVYRYLLQNYLGGAARLTKQVAEFAKEPEAGKVPIIRGFVGDGFDYTPQNKFRDRTEKLDKVLARLDKLSPQQLQREIDKNPVLFDPRVLEAYQITKRELDTAYRARRAALAETTDPNEKEALVEAYRAYQNEWWSAFNYVYESVRKE